MTSKPQSRSLKTNAPETYSSSVDSDDEYIQARIGQTPQQWYRKEEHLGYKVDGDPLKKIKIQTKIEKLLQQEENPNFWRTITDELNQSIHVLSKE